MQASAHSDHACDPGQGGRKVEDVKILLLGGTVFLGSAIASQAIARGHDLTCLARGSAEVPDGAAFISRDRERDDGLSVVSRHRWDSVIDLTRQPGQARRAVRELDATHWVFVSSLNVYRAFDRLEQDEDSPTVEPLGGDVMADMTEYGSAKVACEDAVRARYPSHTIIRSGLIGGAGDWSGRSGYYPWRFANPSGPEVFVPPDLSFPVALIDVEDLAAWLLTCAEQRTVGTFNATGVTTTLSAVLALAQSVAGSSVPAMAVPDDALKEAGISSWMGPSSLPLWIDDPSWRYFATLDTTRARARGLDTRPLEQTLTAAFNYEQERSEPRHTGLTNDDEHRLRNLSEA
ncbi:NAD-dependent epimerase/dehydratase family protein [Phycicoccus elongatus]|uniref:NAD-dependent epimerase/dehydratase family protein n=1 Tax=Phycicoccus elongatus TaxID=101689 RepID=UPI003783C7AB